MIVRAMSSVALSRLALAIALAAGLAGLAGVSPAAAVVYCKTVGVPKGCVARPVAPAAPAARAAVHCTRPGYPVGCAPGVGAPGPGVAPVNAGGPVNRIGVR